MRRSPAVVAWPPLSVSLIPPAAAVSPLAALPTAPVLCSPASAFITGQTLRVDGGMSAGMFWPIAGPRSRGSGRAPGSVQAEMHYYDSAHSPPGNASASMVANPFEGDGLAPNLQAPPTARIAYSAVFRQLALVRRARSTQCPAPCSMGGAKRNSWGRGRFTTAASCCCSTAAQSLTSYRPLTRPSHAVSAALAPTLAPTGGRPAGFIPPGADAAGPGSCPRSCPP